jgi:hypothetical protein
VFGKIRDDPVPMSVSAKGPGNEKDGLTLPRLDVMDIIALNDHKLIHTILGFRKNFVLVIFYHITTAADQKYPRQHE